MPFNPILLKGHERPLTRIKYNREGDLLFSCAKDLKPTVWFADNGERLGTYNGHSGTVWDCDINYNTTRLITGSSDTTARIWNVETGEELWQFQHKAGVRSVAWAQGDQMLMTVTDTTFGNIPTIYIYNIHETYDEEMNKPVREMKVEGAGKMSQALWGPLNQSIIACCDDGSIRVWDPEHGTETQKVHEHKKEIVSMSFSKDQTMFITASKDQTAKLWDVKTLKCLKTYHSNRPLNAAAISPIFNHVIVGGGQEAMHVTTTAQSAGRFEVDFHHIVFQDYMGSVKGHFGPVNTLAFAPDGRSFVSGSEDGYIRMHHFDKEYFENKSNLFSEDREKVRDDKEDAKEKEREDEA